MIAREIEIRHPNGFYTAMVNLYDTGITRLTRRGINKSRFMNLRDTYLRPMARTIAEEDDDMTEEQAFIDLGNIVERAIKENKYVSLIGRNDSEHYLVEGGNLIEIALRGKSFMQTLENEIRVYVEGSGAEKHLPIRYGFRRKPNGFAPGMDLIQVK